VRGVLLCMVLLCMVCYSAWCVTVHGKCYCAWCYCAWCVTVRGVLLCVVSASGHNISKSEEKTYPTVTVGYGATCRNQLLSLSLSLSLS
jgi:hypothetical protein